jgi:hypothetical protein
MAKPRTRTTVLDEVPIDARPEVQIDRHRPDWNSLVEDVAHRIEMVLKRDATGYRYFNPTVTVTCLQPTPEFWRIVGKEQARWCRQAGKTIPRRVRRSSTHWTSGGEWISEKYTRFLHRALSFTGVLFIDGELVPPHSWPKPPAVMSQERQKTGCPADPAPPSQSPV